ncbi:putative TetR family transcriptional regulator [Gordonia hirsuta DSM 44140 = NBRC 16056]|uniref:Putative TetR family transcriptional regulator n=1 Tax=Gordonia hirsuta DSM 44140 = NBRC 16056 TaxID=1121927 RepID=L7LB72_9ACTN|nr:putative TetR family transcriptional regulator [Gordonia hirsuta DSM 44140 = NBRC 16056]
MDPAARRELLLDAAEEAIAASGAQMTLTQVAALAGLTRSAVYAAFADREALLSALARRHSEAIVARLQAAATLDASPREQTRAAVDILAAWFEENPELARLLDQRGEGAAHQESYGAAAVTAVLEAGFTARGLDPAPAATWAQGLIGAVSSAVRWWMRTQTVTREELVDHLTTLIWSGFSGTGDR